MRSWSLIFLSVVLGLSACGRREPARRDEPVAKQAGRAAYQASQDLKHGAKEAVRELRKAGKEASEGWNEAKQENRRDDRTTRPKPRERQ